MGGFFYHPYATTEQLPASLQGPRVRAFGLVVFYAPSPSHARAPAAAAEEVTGAVA